MHRVSITIFLFLLFINSCEFNGEENLIDIKLLDDSQKVIYLDSGEFDLKDYLFPDKNQTNVYRVVKYKDKSRDGIFMLDENEPIEYFLSKNVVREGLDINYTISSFKVKKMEFINGYYDIREYRRFVDINDTYYSYEHIDNKKEYQIGYLVCRVIGHRDIKNVLGNEYKDILELMCKSESLEGVRGFREKRYFSVIYFYARGIGEIEAIGKECSIKYHNNLYKSCINSKKLLKYIKK
jgi:hypothetical protein